MALEHAVDDQVGAARARPRCRGRPSRARGRTRRPGRVYQASSNGRVWSATWNTGVIAVLDERGPDPVEVRVRERLPVHHGRRDHRQPDAAGRERRQLLPPPSRGRAARDARPDAAVPALRSTTVVHHRFHAAHVREHRGRRAGELALPEQSVVREQHRLVQAAGRASRSRRAAGSQWSRGRTSS